MRPPASARLARRRFIVAVAAALWPRRLFAQPNSVRVIGGMFPGQKDHGSFGRFAEGFRRDMKTLGWEEGRNIAFVFRWLEGPTNRLPAFARELVSRPVDVIIVAGDPGIQAAQRATRVIPIVGITDDMLGSGLVASMARPGGNTTGLSILATELDAKRLQLLHEFVPQAQKIALLADPTTVSTAPRLEKLGRELGIEVTVFAAKNREELRGALDAIVAARVGAVNVLASPVLWALREVIMDRVRRARLPAIYQWPEQAAEDGGLLGYGPRQATVFRHAANLVDKILKGAKPADLPIEQPTKFELVINLKTAKALGLTIPPSLLLRADQVIE